MRQPLSQTLIAATTLLLAAATAWGQETAVPKHLQLARDFVTNTKPENNAYSNSKVYTRMPGDLFARDYVVSTDCSGFVEDMFRRAGIADRMGMLAIKVDVLRRGLGRGGDDIPPRPPVRDQIQRGEFARQIVDGMVAALS